MRVHTKVFIGLLSLSVLMKLQTRAEPPRVPAVNPQYLVLHARNADEESRVLFSGRLDLGTTAEDAFARFVEDFPELIRLLSLKTAADLRITRAFTIHVDRDKERTRSSSSMPIPASFWIWASWIFLAGISRRRFRGRRRTPQSL